MNTFFSKIISYAKAHKTISSLIVIAAIVEASFIAGGAGKTLTPAYVLTAARVGTISQTVSGTGQVQGESQISVTPQGSGGEVVSVNVTPGQMVSQGQVLAVLDDSSALLSLDQAKAGLSSAQANYTKVIDGLTSEQQAADQASVTNATQSLAAELISSYTQTNNTLNTQIDTMFSSPTTFNQSFSLSFLDSSGNPITFSSIDPVLMAKVSSERTQLNTLMSAWQNDIETLSLSTTLTSATSTTDLSSHVTLALNNLQYMANFLNDLSSIVYNLSNQNTKYSSVINSYKSTVASTLQTTDSQISSVASSNQSLLTANTNYDVNTAPPTDADVESAQASLENAQASMQSAQNAYDDTRVSAPFAGQVGSVGVEVGNIAGGSTVVAVLTTTQKIADISLNEVDAATVNVGDPATLTFSALPNATVPAYVSQMSLVGTVSSGVVDYDVKLALATSSSSFSSVLSSLSGSRSAASGSFTRTASSTFSTTTVMQNLQQSLEQTLAEIKPGMSVTANIITKSDSNVVVVPSSAVKSAAGGRGSYVQELSGITTAGQISTKTIPQNVTVTTGITNGTQTEIVSGLASGDLIITQTIANGATTVSSAAAATTRSTTGGFGGGALFGGGGAARAGGGAAAIRAF